MSEIVRGYWAQAVCNNDFICCETWSGYNGGDRRDARGARILLKLDASDEELGFAVAEALRHSRWVLPEARGSAIYPEDVEFDMEHYDYKLNIERNAQWISSLMILYGYKTKRALLKDMKNCSIESRAGTTTIRPSHHEKLELWERRSPGELDSVTIPAGSSPAEIGAALRLAFSRCTG